MSPSLFPAAWVFLLAVSSSFSVSAQYLEDNEANKGLFPHVINLATGAKITTNATCGEDGPEVYCKLTDHSGNRAPQCGVCDALSPDPSRRHPITNAIDGTNSWWQSPTLAAGRWYEWVTITIDLKQVYQVAYVIVKSALSPRPGNWVLERSIDGREYKPWQYYALSDAECSSWFGVPATRGRPAYTSDTQVICTSYFSRLNPLEGGEIHTSLVNGRPGAPGPSKQLLEFTEARYVRLRLQRIRTLHGDLQGRDAQNDASVTKRYFYSIKDISIGGRCVCNGHADDCETGNQFPRCSCVHNTCGDSCDTCCPLYNQQPWRAGNFSDGGACEQCQCFGHADSCIYDPEVASKRLSLNTRGEYDGGGVCVACRDDTEGYNCEKCVAGFYRPQGVAPGAERPCRPCACSGPGSTGGCVPDDSQFNLGLFPGACICKEGFHGPRCDRCEKGYRRYPACEPCPCDRAGSKGDECEGDCDCKENVVGPRCDTCAPGHFHLDARNPVGCTACYCNGATTVCEAAKLAVYTVLERANWQVTDLLRRRVVVAVHEENDVRIAHDEMSRFNSYYFLAPQEYLGSRMTSYGQTLKIKVSWVQLRGDTSGQATRCPDVIIEGAGYRIAYGDNVYRRLKSTVLEIPLYEHGWFHFPKDLSDIGPNTKSKQYKGRAVTRREMMEILSSFESLMIRARFHTVQIEGILHDVILEYGAEGTATLVTGAVERCSCPPGFTGLSCESCEPGYWRVNNTIFGGECRKCDCNGHVDTCNPYTGACGECKHNTVGPRCERCAAGFFGDATLGTPDACQPCECPLPLGSNHFTPRCVPDLDLGGYKCQCRTGYTGPKCERCADGYFGNPFKPGNYCQPCECNGNLDLREPGTCDSQTGQCLKCTGNTAGWHCERCKENYYGDASRGQCLSCGCHERGSLSPRCDPTTGQCQCRPLFAGRQCDRCRRGHGGVNEGCPRCQCDPEGSTSQICDPFTGQCPCKPGVTSKTCSQCLPNHYGSLAQGCSRCGCDERGSTSATCDIVSGQCLCKNNVAGRACDSCRPSFWGLSTGTGCRPCDCDRRGSISPQCDDATGQCRCRPGVGGPRCDACLPGYWGFSAQGCKRCDPCGTPGRFCDPNSGRCICPPNTEGDRCERCSPGSWEYHASRGCKPCNCSGVGALNRQCDARTGQCVCKEGYEGEHCGRCSYGFYGFPVCSPCRCSIPGTNPRNCDRKGRCQCDERGQCPCKANVVGRRCGKCISGTFGLSVDNLSGCTSCYCFRRTNQCTQADLTWSQLRMLKPRVLTVEYRRPVSGERPVRPPIVVIRPWNTQEICYINLALPGERILSFGSGETNLNVTNQLHVIPGTEGNVSIVSSLPFDAPLYWQLPREFMRDKVKSYNGYLRFRTQSRGGRRRFPEQILQTYPLISLQGNWQLVLEYYPPSVAPDGQYEVKLHEDYWRLKGEPNRLSREMMMIALQNIQHILIRATHASDATSATLQDVTMDIAAEGSPMSSRVAVAVEQCICPSSYSGTSCQNPNVGHYRWYKDNYITSTIIIDLVGESRRCNCNGRSETCNSETGMCQNCRDNTMGPNCEVCATGYYGNPDLGPCKPCACPSRKQNFAETCQADRYAEYVCNCRTGYTGSKCDRCDYSYYGNPSQPGGSCVPCNCDPFGSVHEGCDNQGQCTCKDGITGRDCSQCAPRHVTSARGCQSCVDGCVDVLLDEVEEMIDEVTSVDMTGIIPAPWPSLREIMNITKVLRYQLNRYHSSVDTSQKLVVEFDLDYYARDLLKRAGGLVDAARETYPPTAKIKSEAQSILDLLNTLYIEIEKTIVYLKNYAIGETPSISVGSALEEAKKILKEIQMRNFTRFEEKADTELVKAELLLERIKKMDQSNPLIQDISFRVDDFDNKLKEMREKIRISNEKTKQAGLLMEGNARRLRRLKEYSGQIRDFHLIIMDQNFNSTQLLKDAANYLLNTGLNFDDIVRLLRELRNSTSFLAEYEAKLRRENQEYRERYVKRAHDHAMDLMRRSIRLESLFNRTRDIAVGPLRAAEAYKRIVDALLSAEEAARNASAAAEKAYTVAYPGRPEDSLVRQASQSLRTSQELQSKGGNLKATVTRQLGDLGKQQRALGTTKGILDITNSRLNALNTLMDRQFSIDISTDIQRALTRTEETNRNVGGTLEKVTSIHTNLTIIRERAMELSRFDTSLLNEIRETINTAKSHTTKGVRLASNMQKTVDRIEIQSKDLRERIEALKRKIKQTRQYASSIRVSLTTDEAGVCTRKYRPTLHPSTTTTIVFTYAVSNAETDALLLYVGSSNSSDFMAVEMVNRRIEFAWDAGGGPQRITHPLSLLTNTPEVSDDTRWYHITINRVGNIGQLSVVPANAEGPTSIRQTPVSDASPPGFSKMDLLPTDTVWVGGAPRRAFNLLKTRKFSGCLYTLSIDGENIGLWNFTESQGCGACNEGEELVLRESLALGFNGKGYFKGNAGLMRPKPYYNTVLSFKTLDEDALLFLAVNDVKNQYFSIALEGGHVVFTVQFDSQTRLVMKSSRRHNNRDMIQIQAIVQNGAKNGARMGRLVVGDQDQLGTVKGGPDLDLSNVPFYFGGVDPEFDRNKWDNVLVLRSVLGCMSGLSVLDKGRNPRTDGQFYGIDSSCSDKPLYDVGFLGRGFVELPSHILKRDSNFGFTFQTMETDALLMVSTFIGQPLPPGAVHPPDFYSVSLVEGHLDIRLNGGGGSHRIMSSTKYNDGRLHAFFVIKENRRVTLKVDDAEVNATRLDRGSQVVVGPDTGGLYFGGVPEDLDIVRMVGSSRPLKGCVRDVIVNNKVVSFSRPIRFKEVYIGRCADLPANAMQGMEADMKVADSCLPPTQHTVEYKALKFGDQLDSHVLVPLQSKTFKKNFEVSFEFRTYYPNGLFFIASNTRRKRVQSLSAELHNGRVKVSLRKDSRKGSKAVDAVSQAGLNTGQWRKVRIERVKKRLSLYIDSQLVKRVKVPRKVNVGRELFLGGLPSRVVGAEEVEPLRGCLRNLNINEEEYEIPSTRRRDQIVGVGQCFASVQPGSYFPGDAYAIYSNDFNVGLMLDLRLEFRTWELNGIILSVADTRGTSLSLELINGAVVLSVDMGVGHSFSARVGLRNRFSFCDNRWHTVKASYIKDSLALRVDNHREAYGFNGSGEHEGAITGAELFIGGLPDTALQGTLTTRENFKGCIRNILLNSERRDWTDMYKLQNVLLSACPVQ
ncbi:laminin subunit alpha-1-like isoform X2 [Eriocheir sinensis]|uniref:laminin subunit alpha-1-like isoform X2 n=1 Tax=Eriocheir sinensis TaxID=95602 RepID=UPI0021C7F832|nr:laminin subunit alpha-1-like isoform X2 [Eriocheir sinensis]